MTSPADPFDLDRFVQAQAPVYETVLTELQSGRKRTHWMWFIFPQIAGLGRSPMAQRYAIKSLNEAKAFLEHPVLGSRLTECAQTVLDLENRSVSAIFGYPDDLKYHSCTTLFAQVTAPDSVFNLTLKKYFMNQQDTQTLKRLKNLGIGP